mgnify:FL=1
MISAGVPIGQGVQLADPIALIEFPRQARQLPPFAEYVPARQSIQLLLSADDIFPGAQAVHTGDPS